VLDLALVLLLQAPAAALPRTAAGEIADPVPCVSNPRFTFALYLPTKFTPEKAWPILYVFDPRGRGKIAAELFREVAERRGFIVASSNDTQSDNPKAPNADVINALWSDTQQRLPIDAKRVYATGFSGGARLACSLGIALRDGLAGVIVVGGGFPPDRPPSKGQPFAVVGLVGKHDFNYYEMRSLDAALGKLSVPHRLEVFDGAHEWPSPEVAASAVEWMDLLAMKKGALALDETLVEGFHARQSERAAALEARGEKAEALAVYEATARDLDGLRDVGGLRAAAERLRRSGTLEEVKRREKLDRRDVALNDKNSSILETIRSGEDPPLVGRALTDLDVPRLMKLAKEDSYDGESAERRLAHILVQSSFYMPRELMERREYRRAATLLQIAVTIRPESPFPQYSLARALSRLGAKREAVEALGKAADNGFGDRARLETEDDLAPLRAEPEFKKLLERLGPTP
jgi:predicted esterase